jgi:DGQHR domain-containing protein
MSFDPTKTAVLVQEIKRPSVGKTPSGYPKIHAELLPTDLMKLIGYDPRSIEERPRKGKDPQNISPEVIELRRTVQRSIDQHKVNEMVEYLHKALSNGLFADWAEIDVVTTAKPETNRYESEFVVVFPVAASYFITDGQHRYCAILDFVRQYPDYAGRFTQAVAIGVLPHDKLTEWAGQSFHDKNYLQAPVRVTKALAVDSRDLHNRLAKELRHHDVIMQGGGVNEVKDSLSAAAKEFATHAVLFKFVRGFCEGRRGLYKGGVDNPRLTDQTYGEHRMWLFDYITELNKVFPHWTVTPGRESFLFRSSAALQALGVIGFLLHTKVRDPIERKKMIENIGEKKLDWKRSNTNDWTGVIGQINDKDGMVSPASSRQAIDGSINFLKTRCGLEKYLGENDDSNPEDGGEIPPGRAAE